jgi:hypothetical protein
LAFPSSVGNNSFLKSSISQFPYENLHELINTLLLLNKVKAEAEEVENKSINFAC